MGQAEIRRGMDFTGLHDSNLTIIFLPAGSLFGGCWQAFFYFPRSSFRQNVRLFSFRKQEGKRNNDSALRDFGGGEYVG